MDEPAFGKTGRFQKANLLAQHAGQLYKVGWIRFASDGGLYVQFHQNQPILIIGEAVQNGELLKPMTCKDVSTIPERERVNIHFSLHPTGKAQVRSGDKPPLVEINIGPWLPLKQPCLLAYLYSPPIGELPRQQTRKNQDRIFSVDSITAGVRATITLLPKGFAPTRPALMGASSRYNIMVEVHLVEPATPGICFAKNLAVN